VLDDAMGPGADAHLRVDFAAHARALRCGTEEVVPDGTLADLRAASVRARERAVAEQRPIVLACHVHPSTRTEAGAWWEVGVPPYLSGRADYEVNKAKQVRWTTKGETK
jgi:3D-(3,5/4)-trihydroxycyclohexane-1,2-dione acylhydrolase (decyclizing)